VRLQISPQKKKGYPEEKKVNASGTSGSKRLSREKERMKSKLDKNFTHGGNHTNPSQMKRVKKNGPSAERMRLLSSQNLIQGG